MPRALILAEPPAAPEPLRMGLLGLSYSVVDELDDAARLLRLASAVEPDIIAQAIGLKPLVGAPCGHAMAWEFWWERVSGCGIVKKSIAPEIHSTLLFDI